MSDSIVARVTRTYVAGLVLTATSIVAVSGVVGAAVVVSRDDEGAISVARTLATELEDHADEPASLDRVARHELAEQHWVGRRIEIWRDDVRLGAPTADGTLGAFVSRDDHACELARVAAQRERVCVVRSATGASIVVATELVPMLAAMLPMLGSMALVALVVTTFFGLLGRRVLAQNLAPLSRFETEVAAVPARARSRTLTAAWGSSELDSLAATFNAMLARIDEAVAREQRFVADAAHELRTPLTRLRAQLELAREEAREGKNVDARLVASVRTAVELGDTTEALLAMAREAVGETEPIELTDLVEVLLARLDESQRARIAFAHESCVTPVVDGTEPLLLLAVGNLVDNALKYGGGSIVLRLEETDPHASVVVEDGGPGIPDEELARIRTPFVRGASSEGTRGAGLGLALVDHVARLHGGALSIENRPEGGLRARLSLRRWSTAAPAEPTADGSPRRASMEADRHRAVEPASRSFRSR